MKKIRSKKDFDEGFAVLCSKGKDGKQLVFVEGITIEEGFALIYNNMTQWYNIIDIESGCKISKDYKSLKQVLEMCEKDIVEAKKKIKSAKYEKCIKAYRSDFKRLMKEYRKQEKHGS